MGDMKERESMLTTLDQFIVDIVKTKQPSTVKELVQLVQKELSIPEEEVLRHIMSLSNKEKLKFIGYSIPPKPKSYIFSTKAISYWLIIATALATSISVFTIPENAYPFIYVRYVLGFVFVLFLPGYSLVKVLFPTQEFDNIERVALSIGTSLALVPFIGLILNYTIWGIRTTSVTISLLVLTTIFATTAMIREQQAKPKENRAGGK